jgi:hypothetical protein
VVYAKKTKSMKKHLPTVMTAVLACFILTLSAQVELPYYSGFDNTAERAGWQVYRTGENALATWNNPPAGGFSPASCISHDYAPSSGAVLADDWYVSPGFLIPAGGTLDSVRYLFSGFSVPAVDDTIGIFMLTGSKNPANATSITLLADFRGDLYQADATYRRLHSVALPATQETAYIAIRYRNAQVSSRWLTVQFDNVGISGITTAAHTPWNESKVSMYPNPCTDVLSVEHGTGEGLIVLRDQLGKVIACADIVQDQSHTDIPVHQLYSGLYYVTIQQESRIIAKTVVKE